MALLARRDFTSQELRAKLDAKGFATAATAAVIADLIRAGLLNDERYAQNYVAYHAGRGQGSVRIVRASEEQVRARLLPPRQPPHGEQGANTA